MAVDADLLHGWLTARSIARRLPALVADHGGWRVDTASATEDRRYVFAAPVEGLRTVGAGIDGGRVAIRLCDRPAVLAAMLPERWTFTPQAYVMTGKAAPAGALPTGYVAAVETDGDRIAVTIRDGAGDLAASGYGATAGDWFAYDRIVVEDAHRRRGLGRALMRSIGVAARADANHVLVATAMGRALYEAIGWRTIASYANAFSPASV